MKKTLLAPSLSRFPTLPIVGIAGRARAGKDTVASFLREEYHCRTFAFADPIKEMLSVLGISAEALDGYRKDDINHDFKATPRRMMQTLGTEWGRDSINADLWVIVAAQRIQQLNRLDPSMSIIITDVRFQNEADFVRKNGFLIHIDRPITHRHSIDGSDHRSEHRLAINDEVDYVIVNDGSLDDLRAETLAIAQSIADASLEKERRHAS